jgi:hypothetical protein
VCVLNTKPKVVNLLKTCKYINYNSTENKERGNKFSTKFYSRSTKLRGLVNSGKTATNVKSISIRLEQMDEFSNCRFVQSDCPNNTNALLLFFWFCFLKL